MKNTEIAKNLYQVAKVLELQNANDRFRIVAYERAATEIEKYPKELTDVYGEGGIDALNKISGVGESIAEKIEELIKTGKLKYLDDIKKEVPVSEVEFISIPGIGPKMAVKIAKVLKAKNIKDLEQKIKSGKADILFKEKTKKNILRGIELSKKITTKMLYGDALPIAEIFVDELEKCPDIIKVNYVGSLRRQKEVVGDIDIVACSKSPKNVIDIFTKITGVTQIITKGENKSTVIYEGNIQVDLEIVPENEYGSLLQHFTGSKEHNVALRTYAITKGLSVSEHGVKKAGELKKFSNEKDLYKYLGMENIPPELRENRGEIEAARKNELPKLVELSEIKGDLHVHSNWSDGNVSISDIVKKSQDLNYEYIAISDHTIGLGIAHGLNEAELEKRDIEIKKVQSKYPKIKILSSVEVNIKADGDLDIKDWMLEKMDIVTASVHTSFYQEKDVMTKRLLGAISHPHVDIIGHPSGRIIGQREPYEVDWPEIFRACRKYGTALEISAFPNRLDLRDYLCQEAKKFGVRFAISTDAHQLHHLDLMRFGVAVARRGWLEKSDIINTQSIDELMSWAKR